MDIQSAVLSLQQILPKEKILLDEPMKRHTTFKTGGNADVLVLPDTKEQIIDIIKLCKGNIPLIVIGNGSNLIVRDKGIRGIVLKIFNNYSKVNVNNNEIIAESGILLSKLSNIALENSLTGLEFAGGIPGTLGGAISMNAGAYGGEMSQVVHETEYVDSNGILQILKDEEHKFNYRKSLFTNKDFIILNSKMRLKSSNPREIKETMDTLNKKRREKQPLQYPSAGSVFKRPEGYYTGKLIEDCGLKGYSIGGAQVSELHAGFIINYNSATSKDILELIKYIQIKVNDKFGVLLETEVKIIGEE